MLTPIIALLVLGLSCSCQASLGPPSWQSDWMNLHSQAAAESFLELSHGLNQLPIKGKAMVRPLDGPNAGLVFEAIGSQQSDDDNDVTYCGVVFVYNETHARLGAPTPNNDKAGGRIFCAGQAGWSDANGNAQSVQEAEVKVVLWMEDAFPPPDVQIDWTPVDSNDADKVFFEFPTGEALDYVTIQVRVNDADGVTWIGEGIGSDHVIGGPSKQIGGVLYSHDATAIYIWVRDDDKGVVNAGDGWGYRKQPTQTWIMAGTGDVRIFGWKSLGNPLFCGMTEVDLDGNQLAEMPLDDTMWDPTGFLVSVQVIPSSGPNEGNAFYSSGVMPRTESGTWPFGGVQFGYSQSLVRFFYPVGTSGCMMHIGENYGGGERQQCARQGRVKVTIWATPLYVCQVY